MKDINPLLSIIQCILAEKVFVMPNSSENLFIGRWKLESCIGTSGGIHIYPLGRAPFGMLTYTEEYMMVFISSNDRAQFSTEDIRAIPSEQILADFTQFETYCGHYAVNHDEKIITHFIENSKVPNQIGTEFRRNFSFEHEKLVLKTIDNLLLNNESWSFELVWTRQE